LNRVGFRALLITDGWDERVTAARVAAALGAVTPGFAAVQLRAPGLTGRALFDAAKQLVEVAHAAGAQLVVNDRVDVAQATGADGVHLPSTGLPPASARRLGGDAFLVGVSTHARGEAEAAQAGGADYVVFGPVYFTPSKAAYGAPVGLAALGDVARAVALPVFALGGVDVARAVECVAAGARVACIGAVLGQADAARAARSLEDALKGS
jgi:thiamine-phosphate pyrophosphorylase